MILTHDLDVQHHRPGTKGELGHHRALQSQGEVVSGSIGWGRGGRAAFHSDAPETSRGVPLPGSQVE